MRIQANTRYSEAACPGCGTVSAGVHNRYQRKLSDTAVAQAPRVLGWDEFALRRGHFYGMLLVDVETRRPVDIPAGRSADSFAPWLAHPGGEVICRGWAGVRAEGNPFAGNACGQPLKTSRKGTCRADSK